MARNIRSGVVKSYNPQRQYGFIKPDDVLCDDDDVLNVFFHRSRYIGGMKGKDLHGLLAGDQFVGTRVLFVSVPGRGEGRSAADCWGLSGTDRDIVRHKVLGTPMPPAQAPESVPTTRTKPIIRSETKVTGKGVVGILDVSHLARQVALGLGSPNVTPRRSLKAG